MKVYRIIMTLLIFIICANSYGQKQIDISKHPGYIDLEKIKIPASATKVTEIDIGPSLLRMISLLGNSTEMGKQLAGFLSIRVKSFEINQEEAVKLKPAIEEIERKLADEKWESIVRVKDVDERTNISIKYDKDKIVGLLLMSVKAGGEITFANIVGNFDLETISKLDLGFENSALDSLRKVIEK